jgi:hypothetical protein
MQRQHLAIAKNVRHQNLNSSTKMRGQAAVGTCVAACVCVCGGKERAEEGEVPAEYQRGVLG